MFLSNLVLAGFTFLTEAAGTAEDIVEQTVFEQYLQLAMQIVPFILIAVGFYFIMIRPQKKQEKATQAMRSGIEIGDQITTIGGIVGVVRQIKDEDIYVVETGADKSRIMIKKWAIQSKDTISDTDK